MIDYNALLKTELAGVYGDQMGKVAKINKWYAIYDGKQEWETAQGLDYIPTKKITNIIKKLVDFRARFMFGKELFFDVRPIKADAKDNTKYQDEAQEKEDLLEEVLRQNKFHSKLLKARKDCSIGGRIAIKLWANKDEGLKIVFSPPQEFFPQFNEDDIDLLEKVIFLYALNDEIEPENQRIKKQVWEMVGDKCILNEGIYNGKAEPIEILFQDHDTGLDFIPVVIIQNGGLTGETEGKSDVEQLWSNQDAYNRLTSDDIDALRFQMFGQDVITDAEENSIKNIKIVPGALIDLQTEPAAGDRQAKVERLESRFTYADKFADTVNRVKNDMYDTLDVPNVGLEQLKGLMQSGKSMKALYWSLMAACDEDWTEWRPALEQMVDYIFHMVDVYNLYKSREVAKYETALEIHHYYPIPEDEADDKRLDMEEVAAQLRSRKAYMDKWGEYENVENELSQIQEEQQMLKDDFTRAVEGELADEL